MVTFKQLWDNHPTITGDQNPCQTKGVPNYSDQCSIRIGACLARAGVNVLKIPKLACCWYHKRSDGHFLRAEELASGLTKCLIGGIKKAQNITPGNYVTELNGKTGIIFFKDYWLRKGERTPSGDHIDLWNGSRLTDSTSYLRIHMNLVIPGLWSDYKQAKKILFWQVE